jgi:predicted O-methyltransferase YrrM
MSELVADDITDFARTVGPQPDEILTEMDEYGKEIGFPTVGPAVGGWLATLARLVDAERVFEFGSGFGYSAYWFARALPPTGEVVLTEIDADELDRAREYFDRGDLTERATFEQGDAIDYARDYEGPFDVVLIDNEKHRYEEAFDAIREKVAPGGVVIADNAMTSTSVDFETVLEIAEGGTVEDANESTRGVAAYLAQVRADPDFETAAIPLGEGITVSHHVA